MHFIYVKCDGGSVSVVATVLSFGVMPCKENIKWLFDTDSGLVISVISSLLQKIVNHEHSTAYWISVSVKKHCWITCKSD